MGVLKNGIFGGISGRIGNRIYYMYKGKQVVRMAGNSVPKTPKQLGNLQGMKVVVDFLKPTLPFIKAGFGVEGILKNKAAYHLAVGINKRQALRGEYPEIEIDYEKMVLSVGTLEGLTDVSVSAVGHVEDGFSLRFDWEVSAEEREWPRGNDQVMLMAYFPEESADFPACFTIDGAKRSTGQDVLELPFYVAGKPIEVYVSVIAEDGTEVANSQYLGRFII